MGLGWQHRTKGNEHKDKKDGFVNVLRAPELHLEIFSQQRRKQNAANVTKGEQGIGREANNYIEQYQKEHDK